MQLPLCSVVSNLWDGVDGVDGREVFVFRLQRPEGKKEPIQLCRCAREWAPRRGKAPANTVQYAGARHFGGREYWEIADGKVRDEATEVG